jgi:hypothetical protein
MGIMLSYSEEMPNETKEEEEQCALREGIEGVYAAERATLDFPPEE